MLLGFVDVIVNFCCCISVFMVMYLYVFLCLCFLMIDRGWLGLSFFVLFLVFLEYVVFWLDDWFLVFELDFNVLYCIVFKCKLMISFF